MRLFALSLVAFVIAGCSQQAPGVSLTDVTATNTENTGPYEILDRTDQDGIVRLRVRAVVPDEAEHVAEYVLYQALPTADRGVVVEVYADASDAEPIARMEAMRAAAHRIKPPPESQPSGQQPGSADRLGVPGQEP